MFCLLMEEAIAARPRPRAYLAPRPPAKYTPADTFAPAIDPHSKQLAAKIRPKVRRARVETRAAAHQREARRGALRKQGRRLRLVRHTSDLGALHLAVLGGALPITCRPAP